MDRWKAEMERVREKRRVEERRSEKRKSQKKEDADARKGRKVANHCVFSMICGSGGSKSRLAKAAGAEPSGQMRDEKLHAVVARSTFRSQNVQNTPCSDHFWKLRCRKSARRCGAKYISKSKCTKHLSVGPLLEVEMSKKCTPLWREVHFEVKMYKTHHARTTLEVEMSKKCTPLWCEVHFKVKCTKKLSLGPLLDVEMSFRVAGARDCGSCQKWANREGFVAFPKTMAGVGHLKRICIDAFSVAGAVQKTFFIWAVRRWGRRFPERGCILEHQIFRFAKMILRDRCSTSHDLASIFRGRRSTLDRWSEKIAKSIVTRLSALHFTFHFSTKSRRIALFLMLSSSKLEEVSQNCFVFDVVKFKNWRSLAELLRFGCCQVQKLQTSRRIVSFYCCQRRKMRKSSFSSLQIDRGIDRQTDRHTDRQTDRERERESERDRWMDR